MSFLSAVAQLSAEEQSKLQSSLDNWASGSAAGAAIVANLKADLLLPEDTFVALLRDFLSRLDLGETPEAAFPMACRPHKFAGPLLKGSEPQILGRAVGAGKYRRMITKHWESHPSALTQTEVEALITKLADPYANATAFERRYLQEAPIGEAAIWSTFDDSDRSQSPWSGNESATDVLNAFGLGPVEGMSPEPVQMLLAWDHEGAAALHIPTIADGSRNPWFRPVTDPFAEHGWTLPLNPATAEPRPEVVHRQISGKSLHFPLLRVY